MLENTKEQLQAAGKRVAENLGDAADWVKEKTGMGPGRAEGSDAGIEGIRHHMNVVASCGTVIGRVDSVDGSNLKLTKDSFGDDQHHFIPTSMVDHVDRHVHLTKNADEAKQWCTTDASTCGLVG